MHPRSSIIVLSLSLACTGSGGGTAELGGEPGGHGRGRSFDWAKPASALELDAGEVASRIGSFEWTAAVEWTVSREGEDARRVRSMERHRIRQASTGEFEVAAEIDPGLGPGSVTGKEIVYVGGMTYGRARWAPFRERPTDRGRDARRFRGESFLVPLSLARLIGPALAFQAAGEDEALRRSVRKFVVSLDKGKDSLAGAKKGALTGVLSRSPPGAGSPEASDKARAADEDTKIRRAFLAGLRPWSASGELLLDAATGAPIVVRLSAAFTLDGDPKVHVEVNLLAQVRATGGEVGAVSAPSGALPDERKAAGVADALEAAGLKKAPEEKGEKKGRAEPEEAGEE